MTIHGSRTYFVAMVLCILATVLFSSGCTSSRLGAMPPTSEVYLVVFAGEILEVSNLYEREIRKDLRLGDGTDVTVEGGYPHSVVGVKNGVLQFALEGSWYKIGRFGSTDAYVYQNKSDSISEDESKMEKAKRHMASLKTR